jgi:protoporphyrinogen oxidase
MFGLGVPTTVRILADYVWQSLNRVVQKKQIVSLEDWVVAKFGRTMFNIYFREYSEKVWGIDCGSICATWVARRIKGLSLAKAIRNGLFKLSGKDLATLTDTFLYPSLGIGRLAERLREEIEKRNEVLTGSAVVSVNHRDLRAESITIDDRGGRRTLPADEVVSTVPITRLVAMLNPAPPSRILATASRLEFRDLLIVALMIDRPRVTNQTWIYIPEKKIPFGRIHEPTNWSRAMAPPDKSLLVLEFFSFKNDPLWRLADDKLVDLAVDNVVKLGFIDYREVLDSAVVRVPNAYPLFRVGYRKHLDELYGYLSRFRNIHVAGRSGMFEYYNMDAALRSGIEAAGKLVKQYHPMDSAEPDELLVANTCL